MKPKKMDKEKERHTSDPERNLPSVVRKLRITMQ